MRALKIIIASLIAGKDISAEESGYDLRLNQIGFLPNSIKTAAVVNSAADSFRIMTTDRQNNIVPRGSSVVWRQPITFINQNTVCENWLVFERLFVSRSDFQR